MIEEARPIGKGASPSLQTRNPSSLLKVADDRTAGQNRPSEYTYRDPVTGITYRINPGWKIMPRKSLGAMQADGLIQTWTDWSHQVETRIYECVSPTLAQHQDNIGCQVEPDFILVGGGAWADYGNGPGALLWETRPLDVNLMTWVASSKDHEVTSPHWLHTYAIGLRLKDNNGAYISRSSLVGSFIWFWGHQTTTLSHAPAESLYYYRPDVALIDADYFSSGARLNWNCCGALLTQSKVKHYMYEMNTNVAGKDHRYSDPSTITAYGIGTECDHAAPALRQSSFIPGFGRLEFKVVDATGGPVATGVSATLVDAEPEYVVTGAGGESKWTSGSGRLLFGIKPTGVFSPQFTIYSKDHKVVSGGYNIASIVQVRKAH